MHIVLALVAVAVTVVAVALVTRTVLSFIKIIKLGQPDPTRMEERPARVKNMLIETLGHTRLLKWTLVGTAHWFVFVGFGFLFFTLVTAYGQLFDQ
ncbi:MAG: Fe-S oxidoreductase, partial [Jatrophihabitantaceae bacterium]|nr:Fe-S oxidoreductase [Jatrophihabitantaceae bacterium]